jgi:putative transposase
VEPNHFQLSVRRQCALLGISRASLYYESVQESEENLELMRLIDRQYTRVPFYGSRRMTAWLQSPGSEPQTGGTTDATDGNRGGVRQTEAESAGPGTRDLSLPAEGMRIERKDQVWCTDITYIPLLQGFLYLVAVMDWFSRFVLSWALSLTMELDFCLEALKDALRWGRPEIFNSDQGSQFISETFLGELEQRNIAISMDGRGRCRDNIFIERLWRSLKYEEVYLT